MKTALKKLQPFLEKAIESYQIFANADCPMQAKDFNAYHTACKAALLHIALLGKILNLSEDSCPNKEPDLLSLLNQAKEDLKDENDLS